MIASEAIVVAIISFLGVVIVASIGFLGIYWQNRNLSNAQRSDHANTAEKVDLLAGHLGKLVDTVDEVKEDVRDVKADVRDVKEDVRTHSDRLKSLERMGLVQDHTEAVVEDNNRKLHIIREAQTEGTS